MDTHVSLRRGRVVHDLPIKWNTPGFIVQYEMFELGYEKRW
jgi:hypothetical protein